MNKYLLSVDPSMKNTGFTLGEKTLVKENCRKAYVLGGSNQCNCCNGDNEGQPILINSFNFQKDFGTKNCLGENNIKSQIGDILGQKACELENRELNYVGEDYCLDTHLIIERGTFHAKNGIGYETQEHLRGFIAGQFNKLLTKDMLISPSEGKNHYIKTEARYIFKIREGTQEHSISLANILIIENNGNITISNHDEADSLLIGGYYLNKENE